MFILVRCTRELSQAKKKKKHNTISPLKEELEFWVSTTRWRN